MGFSSSDSLVQKSTHTYTMSLGRQVFLCIVLVHKVHANDKSVYIVYGYLATEGCIHI